MQNFVPRKKFYHINGIDESEYSKEAYERYEKLVLIEIGLGQKYNKSP